MMRKLNKLAAPPVEAVRQPERLQPRLVVRKNSNSIKIIPTGRRRRPFGDIYASLLGASWKRIVALLVTIYLMLNFLFAGAYFLLGDGIENAKPGSFADTFFFSVQTLSTIGYGGMTPKSMSANILMTIESMFGLAFLGVVTGLMFSKFSRPTARVIFSDKAVIGKHDGVRHFMLRLANERNNQIVDAQAKLTFMRDEISSEGTHMRRFYDLPLVRSENPVLRFTWTVMHRIDEKSPLYDITPERLREQKAEIIISLKGIDETLAQSVHARHSYIADEIVCNATFADVLHRRADSTLEVRYDKFHQIVQK
jgi:inward rectifier potassium channel